jgi:putative FmdB family regulatory protein
MPIYEYECNQCRTRFEKRQRFYDEAVADCPQCESNAHRVFSVGAVIYKGSGFYVTDARKRKILRISGNRIKKLLKNIRNFPV